MFAELWEREVAAEIQVPIRTIPGDTVISIAQDWEGSVTAHGIHSTVWEAGFVLQEYLQQLALRTAPRSLLQGKRVLEIGAGTGLVGLVCSILGAHVTMTDLPVALPLLHKNAESVRVQLEDLGREMTEPTIRPLDWTVPISEQGIDVGEFELVIGADVIYNPALFPHLATTIRSVIASPRQTLWLANRLRGVEREFFDCLKAQPATSDEGGVDAGQLSVEWICEVTPDSFYGRQLRGQEKVHIYQIKRSPRRSS
jgi:hypothetical protein